LTGAALLLALSAQFYSDLPQFQRLSFNLPVGDSGVAIGLAGRMEYLRPDYVVASGGVDVRFGTQRIQANRIEIDLTDESVLAEGGVILDDGPQRLAGARLDYDMGSKTGTVYEANASFGKDLYFFGAEMSKVGPDSYVLSDGVLTSCDSEVPAWSFKLSRARVVMDGFARIYNTTMRAKNVPFLYLPFVMMPAKTQRTSGFLAPNLGYSDRYGSVIGLAYFQTLGDSYDATFFADWYSEGLSTFATEFRYAPVQGTYGEFEGFVVDDPNNIFGSPEEPGDLRWRVNWRHRSLNLPFRLTAAADITDFSDFNFFRDFSRNFDAISIRNIQSRGYVSGAWGKHSASLLIENQEQFIQQGVTRSRRQLPELEYQLRSVQVGNLPVYVSTGVGLHSFSVEGTEIEEKIAYERAYVTPRVSVPVGTTWLSATLNVAARAATYTDSLSEPVPVDPDDPDNMQTERVFTGESISQSATSVSANIIGPSFSRVFHKGAGQWGKFKHVIEPRWDYSKSTEVDNGELIPRFDQIDTIGAASERATFRFVNRLLAKPEDESSPFGAREIMSLEIAQSFSFNDDQPFTRFTIPADPTDPESEPETLTLQESPIDVRYRWRPSLWTNLDFSTQYNTLFNKFNKASVSAAKTFGPTGFNLTYSTNFHPMTGDTLNSQLRVGTLLKFLNQRLSWRAGINYDIEQSLLQQQSHYFDFITQCWGLHLILREYQSLNREDRDIRFSMSLKNIGRFLGVNSTTRPNQLDR